MLVMIVGTARGWSEEETDEAMNKVGVKLQDAEFQKQSENGIARTIEAM